MRIKKTYIVLSFRTTLDAMEWEKQCLAEKVPGRLIPLPREISAGCGLAWRMLPPVMNYASNSMLREPKTTAMVLIHLPEG